MAHVQVYPWKACFFYATNRSIFKLKPSPQVRVILFLITHTHRKPNVAIVLRPTHEKLNYFQLRKITETFGGVMWKSRKSTKFEGRRSGFKM